jgi:uncharacterized repeat protein (TIGR03803 family)
LVSFDVAYGNGANPLAGLTIDANGNLFGTTAQGGPSINLGTIFELPKTSNGYANTPTISSIFYTSIGGNPQAPVLADGNGNLFGTTTRYGNSVVTGFGSVFGRLSSGNVVAFYFNGVNGSDPLAGLVMDTNGNLFGTTYLGGPNGDGTVFEIASTAPPFVTLPTVLVNFTHANGRNPRAGLIIDGEGNLFGTTYQGGASDQGIVFEIPFTANPPRYASNPTTLVTFNGPNGSLPNGEVIMDGAGNLFGTTTNAGQYGFGTVFEIAKTDQGYASTPTTLVNFNNANGSRPQGPLFADAAGTLFGTTIYGGEAGNGTVFAVVNSGFVPILANKKGGPQSPPAPRSR